MAQRGLGAERVADLLDVLPEDLAAFGCSKIESNRFFRAVANVEFAVHWDGARHGSTLDLLLALDGSTPGRLARACSAAGLSDNEAVGVAAAVESWGSAPNRRATELAATLSAVAIADAASAAMTDGAAQAPADCGVADCGE